MLTFYLIAGGLAALAAMALVRPLVAGRGEAESRDARDAQVFRDQLAEIDRDLTRGVITPSEAEGARVEVSRRLIAAAERARRGEALAPAPQGHSGLVAGLALVGAPALAAALYFALGEPGAGDQPLSTRLAAFAAVGGGLSQPRPGQAEAEAQITGRPPPPQADPQYAALVEQLEAVVASRPDDAQGQMHLANALMNLGRYAEAWRVYSRVIDLSGGAVDPQTRAAMAEGMILAAGGYVSPEAEAQIARALKLDPSLAIARYYGGLALRQSGRLDEAVAMWRALRRDSPPDAPWLPWLEGMLADADRARGAPPGVGPTREDIAAAENLSPEERSAMIEGMVASLDDRLSSQGGTAEEWGRLIASYATLGRMEAAGDAYARALAALGDGPGAEAVRAQAARLGLAAGSSAAPGAAPGPTQAEIEAAQRLSPDERMAMVDGMVARLDDRLATQGGTAEEWGRLVASYATLGRIEQARDAYRRGLGALDGPEADALAAIAARAGIEPAGEAGPASAPEDRAATTPAPGAIAAGAPAGDDAGRAPGPTAADIAAAAEMSPDERATMVEGMVARLESRLTGEGGSAEEWLRLVDSYVRLGRKDDADRAYRLAAEALADDPAAGFVKEQAMLMGVAVE